MGEPLEVGLHVRKVGPTLKFWCKVVLRKWYVIFFFLIFLLETAKVAGYRVLGDPTDAESNSS